MASDTRAGIAESFRQLRLRLGLTQAQAADKAGMPRTHWAKLETGVQRPSRGTVARVAEAFAVRIDEIDPSGSAFALTGPRGPATARTVTESTHADELQTRGSRVISPGQASTKGRPVHEITRLWELLEGHEDLQIEVLEFARARVHSAWTREAQQRRAAKGRPQTAS